MNNKNIATLATKALLYEVSISPKAGLVSRLSNGSHKDMNFYTFIDSSLALHNYFLNCFDYGQEKLFSCPNFFKDLREVGKVAEKEMYEATKGINTHKGTIFSMGILLAVLGVHLKENKKIDLKVLSEKIKEMCKPLLNELEATDSISRYGENEYKEYHFTCEIGLAISGNEIVFLDGINKLKDFCKTLDFETACILLLFYYMSVLDDTNIVNRASITILKEVQILSKELFEENKKTTKKLKKKTKTTTTKKKPIKKTKSKNKKN